MNLERNETVYRQETTVVLNNLSKIFLWNTVSDIIEHYHFSVFSTTNHLNSYFFCIFIYKLFEWSYYSVFSVFYHTTTTN